MVQLAPGVGAFAAVGRAGVVDQAHGDALGFVEEPLEPAEVEDSRLAAEHGGDDAGVAGQPAGLAGADRLAGVEAGRLEPVAQLLLVDGHHDGGGGLGVQVVGGQVLQELAERQPASVVPVGAQARSSRRPAPRLAPRRPRRGAVIVSRTLRSR